MNQLTKKETLYKIIFEANTPAGKWFDIVLIGAIIMSVIAVMLESVALYHQAYKNFFVGVEWFFTLAFTVEYVLRIYCAPNRRAYIFSFYGFVDLLSIIPTYLGLFLTDAHYLVVIRILRIQRIFRILKLTRYVNQANVLTDALMRSREKVIVFFLSIFTLTVIVGSIMYVIEGEENGFTSIPKSIYWAIVTVTTVGYGDISPQTNLGQAFASLAMITGYSIIAVPTGIFAAELSQAIRRDTMARSCPSCKKVGHEQEANYCYSCGAKL